VYRSLRIPVAMAALCILFQASTAQATTFNLDSCGTGDCWALGGGSVLVDLEVIDGTNLLITITNSLVGDGAFLQKLGIAYDGSLAGVTIEDVDVLEGTVDNPTLFLNQKLTSFLVDVGAAFANTGTGRFSPDEVIEIKIATTGLINPLLFTGFYAKVGGVGANGNYSATLTTPEPSTLVLFSMASFGAALLRRRRRS
jgi:hypothetical protein